MVYKKYIRRNGKVFGPYYYESNRINGRVVNSYVSREEAKGRLAQINPDSSFLKSCKVTLLILLVLGIVVLAGFVLIKQTGLTGRVSYSSELTRDYHEGEDISGNLLLKVREGELIPATTKLVVELEVSRVEKQISELAVVSESEGDFFVESASISGSGTGYGLAGIKITYPYVDFELRIINSSESRGSDKKTADDSIGMTGESVQEEPSLPADEPVEEEIPVEEQMPALPVSEETTEESVTESSASAKTMDVEISINSGTSEESEPSLITGSAISEQAEEGIIISGSVKSGENFIYALEDGQSAELVAGSVKVNGEAIGDDEVDVKVNPTRVKVSTNYSLTEEGYGQDYLGAEMLDFLSLNLSNLGIPAKEGVLRVSLDYNNEEIFSFEENINVIPASSNESAESNYSDYADSSEGGGGTAVLRMIKDIPKIEVLKGRSFSLNLSEYFEGAVNYGAGAEGLRIDFDGEIITIKPDGLSGEKAVKITAYGFYENIESNEFIVSVLSGESNIKTSRGAIRLGEPVRWVKNISLAVPEDITIELPASAYNISVRKIEQEKSSEIEADYYVITGRITAGEDYIMDKKRFGFFEFLARFFRRITGVVVADAQMTQTFDENRIELVLAENSNDYIVEYYTEAPTSVESELPNGKRVVISGPDELSYSDVVAFANVPEIADAGEEEMIKILWADEGTNVPFDAYDSDEDGKLDYVEWVVPHLSNQTFEIIIITNAEHLDESRNFVEDVYDFVKERDGVWKEIPAGHYLRVRFEKELDNSKDITIYARSNSSGNVEVYEKDRTEKIADFGGISNDGEYKIYLTNLVGEQDVFDLKIIGNVEFDYVVDPSFSNVVNVQTCVAEDFAAQGSFADACDYPDAYSLLYSDTRYETHTFGKLTKVRYGGVKVLYRDTSVNTCLNVTSVALCYEWWASGPSGTCDISIDLNNGTSWTAVTTSCPGTTPIPGITCIDVTSLENWNCSVFFGENATGALLKSEIDAPAAGQPVTEISTWGVLQLKINYSLSSTPPKWSNIQTYPASPVIYSPDSAYQFNVTWTDDYQIDNVTIEHNFAGSWQNFSVTNLSSVYYYDYNSLGAGNYSWRMFAADNDNQYNYTAYSDYNIIKNTSAISLYLDGSQLNDTIYENESANITVILSNPVGGYIYLYFNGSLINEGNSPISNFTLPDLSVGTYNITAIYPGNNNYTSSSKTYYLTMRSGKDSEAPVIAVIHPSFNQTLKGNVTINLTTDEDANCRYSTYNLFAYISGTLFEITGSTAHLTSLVSLGEGAYNYYVKCNDSTGNINTLANQANISFVIDNTPPDSVSNLKAITRDYQSIYWNWTNPSTSDFNLSILFINEVNVANLSVNYYNATDLIPSTIYTAKLLTKDKVGNVNLTEIINVTSTLTDNAPIIYSISAIPNPYYTSIGGNLNFSANITDDFNVTNVSVLVNGNQFEMTLQSGLYRYSWNNPSKITGVYSYTIIAYDRFRQSNSTSYFTIISETETEYIEHSATRVFNTSDFSEILLQANKSFIKNVESLGWNFTKDYAEDYGGVIIDAGSLTFSGGFGAFSSQDSEKVYIRWELVELNVSDGSEIIICSTPSGTGGALVAMGMSSYSKNCEMTSQYYISPGKKLRVKIYGYNPSSQARTIGHYWDTKSTSSEYIIPEIQVGNYTARVSEPSSNISVTYREGFTITCAANCSGGFCFGVNSWLQYHNGNTWVNASYSSSQNISLNESSSNPHAIGTIYEESTGSYLIYGNAGDIDVDLRCMMRNIYNGPVYSSNRTIHIIGIDAPNVSLISPANGSVISTTNNMNFSCNASDKNGLKNISLYWDYGGLWQSAGSTGVSGKYNITTFEKIGLSNENITWNCFACDKHSNCSFARNNWTVTINYTPPAPSVNFVSPVDDVSPIESGYTNVIFSAQAYNPQGVGNINHTSVEFNISNGIESIEGACAYTGNISSYSANYSCIAQIWYFNGAGFWNVSVKVKNLGGDEYGFNSTTQFLYYQLISVLMDRTNIEFGEIFMEKFNKTALSPVEVNNTGNANLGAEINSTDLYGNIDQTDIIDPRNFSVSGVEGFECIGTSLISGDFVSVGDFILDYGNISSGHGSSDLRFCIPKVPEVPSQNYSNLEESDWIIRVFAE